MQERRGAAWVAEPDGAVAGLAACWPRDGDTWEIGKMYVGAAARGSGAATALLDAAEQFARTQGAVEIVLWSDTRFLRAHAFYEKHCFVRSGPIRALGDKSNSVEFGFSKPIRGVVVRVLDVAAAYSAERPLADLLVACVADGASVSFLPPLQPSVARAFWRKLAAQVATSRRILVVAWADGVIAGTVTVDCDTPENQPHRADVQKLLVHPWARRRGIGRALVETAEDAARKAGRTLLTLDTLAGDAGEPLYRSVGFVEAGRIPGYALNADLIPYPTVVLYKQLAPVSS
jgi:GNAT superfamily N-acetyltransferase